MRTLADQPVWAILAQGARSQQPSDIAWKNTSWHMGNSLPLDDAAHTPTSELLYSVLPKAFIGSNEERHWKLLRTHTEWAFLKEFLTINTLQATLKSSISKRCVQLWTRTCQEAKNPAEYPLLYLSCFNLLTSLERIHPLILFSYNYQHPEGN